MATRSRIGLLEGETVKSVYCHWDGYPSHNGRILVEFYKDIDRVKELLELGNLSVLAPRIHPEGVHTFENREKDTCLFYSRDRKDENESAIVESLEDYLNFAQKDWSEYHYLYKDGEWYYVHMHDEVKNLEPLTQDIFTEE